ncbi:hypothetical protein D3C80_1008740 [compost metagenome]
MQCGEAQVFTKALAVVDFDAADLQQERHFALGEIIHQLVFGDAVFVEPAGFIAGLEHHHIVTLQGQSMGTGQARRACTDHGHALARGGGALEGVAIKMRVVQGIALQLTNQYRCAFLMVVTHAGLLAQHFRGADPGATATQNVGREDLLGSALDVLLVDVADEGGDVDAGGARVDARRVVAIQATGAFQLCLARVQRWRQVAEAVCQGRGIVAWVRQMVQGFDHGHDLTFLMDLPGCA